MHKKSSARLLIFSGLLEAVALESRWTHNVEDFAGTKVVRSQTGAELHPSLYAVLILTLACALSLYVLPRVFRGAIFLLTLVVVLVAGVEIVKDPQWVWPMGVSVAALVGVITAVVPALRNLFHEAPTAPRERTIDPWTALDRGLDPTRSDSDEPDR